MKAAVACTSVWCECEPAIGTTFEHAMDPAMPSRIVNKG